MSEITTRIVMQTESYRVIAKNYGPFEGKPREDEIIIERKRTAAMGEEYWGPVHELDGRSRGMTNDERLLLSIFQEIAKLGISFSPSGVTLTATASEPVHLGRVFSADVAQKAYTRANFSRLLRIVCATVKGPITLPPDMPFDSRDLGVALNLSPAAISELQKTFPGIPYELEPFQLIAKLLTRAAEELSEELVTA